MGRSAVEREVKLAAEPEFVLPDLGDLVDYTTRLPAQQLWADYFDSPDLRLWDRKITLRHRTGEVSVAGVWTLKLPAPGSGPSFDRTELTWIGGPDRVPEPVSEILRGVIRRSDLHKIATLETARRRMVLYGKGQRVLAEIDDDIVTVHGGPRDGDRFRQIEVELDQADDRLLGQCLERLYGAGARTDVKVPKVARAIGAAPGRGLSEPLGARSSIGDVVRGSILAGFGKILDHELLVRLTPDDPPVRAVHQARVATWRLRSDLKTFAPLLDPVWVGHVREDLAWVADALGAVRDADVLAERFGDAPEQSTSPGGVLSILNVQRRSAADRLLVVLTSTRYELLLDRLHAAAQRPPFFTNDARRHGRVRPDRKVSAVLPDVVGPQWKKLRKAVRAAGDRPTDRQLHRIRIRAKQLRYAAEAAEPVIGKRARRTASAAEDLQTVLGDHHDAVVAEQWLRELARGAPSELAFEAGLLTGAQRQLQAELGRRWGSRWKRVDRRSRVWLR